jgi:hypothetical protein
MGKASCLIGVPCRWWSRRIGRNFLIRMIALGVPQVREIAAPAALDLGGALCPRASRGGV